MSRKFTCRELQENFPSETKEDVRKVMKTAERRGKVAVHDITQDLTIIKTTLAKCLERAPGLMPTTNSCTAIIAYYPGTTSIGSSRSILTPIHYDGEVRLAGQRIEDGRFYEIMEVCDIEVSDDGMLIVGIYCFLEMKKIKEK